MFRIIIRIAHQIDKLFLNISRFLEAVRKILTRWAEFILPDGLATAVVAGFIQIVFVALQLILNTRKLFIPLRVIVQTMIASPQLLVAILLLPYTNIYFAITIIFTASLIQYAYEPAYNWGLAWLFRIAWPYQYWEAIRRSYPGTADDQSRRFVSPLLGVPRFENNIIEFSITPGIGRSLEDLNSIMKPLASQFPPIQEIINDYDQNPSLSKGKLKLVLKDAPNKPITEEIPKAHY